MKRNHNYFLDLAFNLAKINLGKTFSNPSVGCVVVKNNSVISSGYTSVNGRPHAEFNSLNKKINFKGSYIYTTMEPCVHFGQTPPCTNIIKKKGVKRVYYAFSDLDKRTKNKSKKILKKNNIDTHKIKNINNKDFYQSYAVNHNLSLPLVDAKIAISKDYFTINTKKKWITNYLSRIRAHLIRSKYDSIISTSETINNDNSLLNCRINGFNKNKPDLIIIDRKLKINTSLDLFKLSKKRKIFIITSVLSGKKISLLRKKGVKFIKTTSLDTKKDFIKVFKELKIKGFNRILVETGLKFLNVLVKDKLIYNLYVFKSLNKLGKIGQNNVSTNILKKIKLNKKIKINLNGDQLYKVKIK